MYILHPRHAPLVYKIVRWSLIILSAFVLLVTGSVGINHLQGPHKEVAIFFFMYTFMGLVGLICAFKANKHCLWIFAALVLAHIVFYSYVFILIVLLVSLPLVQGWLLHEYQGSLPI